MPRRTGVESQMAVGLALLEALGVVDLVGGRVLLVAVLVDVLGTDVGAHGCGGVWIGEEELGVDSWGCVKKSSKVRVSQRIVVHQAAAVESGVFIQRCCRL